jgi:membrane protease YdiL (CAAX protease family)
MKIRNMFKKPLTRFVTLSYVLFFMFFMMIGLGMMLGVPKSMTDMLKIISAWSSTFAFLILFKRIYPGLKLKDYVKEHFTRKIRITVLCTGVLIQIFITAVVVCLLTITNDTKHLALSVTSPGLLFLLFFNHLVKGPLGEELGWRGYALNELQKKYSPLRSALIVGVLWGFWHTPLWFASGYTGVYLIKYMALFLIGIISFSVIVTLFYNLNKNLMIPIVMHQLFNFLLAIIKGDLLDIFLIIMLSYFVVAVILIVINPFGILYKKQVNFKSKSIH